MEDILTQHMPNVDVWMCNLERAAGAFREPALEDRQAAESYTNERLRSRFLISRWMLRSILSEYAGISGEALRFRQGRYGKLYLRRHAGARVHFNISHSRDRLLVAVSTAGPVGVDIEHVRPIDAAWLARYWFSRTERREWAGITAASRLEAFFHGWARKEAFIKATGFGLAMPLDSFSVSLQPRHAELREVRGVAPGRWRLNRIDAGPDCAAAVVTCGEPGEIRIREAA